MRVVLVGSRRRPTGTLLTWLTDRGHEVHRLNRSELRVGALRRLRPDLVVISATVGTHAAAACAALRRTGLSVPILAAGLATDAASATALLDAGVDDVIAAPLDRVRFDLRLAVIERGASADRGSTSEPGIDPASLEALLKSFPDRIFTRDRDLRFTWANQATLDFLGMRSLNELIGKTEFDLHRTDEAELSAASDRELIESRAIQRNVETRFVDLNHSQWVSATRVPVLDKAGRVTGLVGIARDISDVKRLQAQAEDNQGRLRDLVDSLPELVAELDDGTIQLINGPGVSMLGAPSEEAVVGRLLREFVAEDRRTTLDAILAAARRGHTGGRVLTVIRRADGSTFTAELAVVKPAQRRQRTTQVVIRDVSDATTARTALELSDEKLRMVMANAPDQIVMLDRQGTIQYINRTRSDVSPEQVIGHSVLEFIAPPYRDKVKADIKLVFETGRTMQVDAEAVGDDGQMRWISARIGAIRQDGEVKSVIAINSDISDRRRTEDELRMSEERWRALVANAPDIISMIDREGRFLFVNRTLPGQQPEDMLGKTIFDFADPTVHDVGRALLEQLFDHGESGAIEVEAIGEHGAPAWYATRFAPIRRDNEVVAAVVISTDTTKRRAAEEELRRREERYRTLARSIPDAVVLLFDADLTVTVADGDARLQAVAVAVAEAEGQTVGDIMPASLRAKVMTDCRHALGGDSRHRILTHGGRTYEIRALPVRQPFGEIDAGILMVQDISARTQTEADVQQATAEFEGVFRCMPNAAVVADARGSIAMVNPAFSDLFGYTSDDIAGQSIRTLYANERDFTPLAAVPDSPPPPTSRASGPSAFRRWDGGQFVGNTTVTPLADAAGTSFGYIMIVEDITERTRTEAVIRARALQQAEVAHLGQRALAGVDQQALIEAAVRTVGATLGVQSSLVLKYEPERDRLTLAAGVNGGADIDHDLSVPVGEDVYPGCAINEGAPVIVGDARAEARFEIAPILRDMHTVSGVTVVIQGAEAPHGVMCVHSAEPRTFDDDDVNFLRAVANVIAAAIERKEAESIIGHMAFHDPLTGLANRILFNDRFRMALEHARRNNETLGVLFVDLDAFKIVNDSLGHSFGDRVLPEVARRLQSCLRATDTVARVGGDEFVILLPELDRALNAVPTADRIIELMRQPIEIDDCEIVVGASVGISTYPADGSDSETLLTTADRRMYRAKERGGRDVEGPSIRRTAGPADDRTSPTD